MTNVTRYAKIGTTLEATDGSFVLFTDYQAKCLEVERLRKALEKYGEHDDRCNFWLEHPGDDECALDTAFGCNCGLADAISGLTPAAGIPEEADETVAARKDK